MWKRKCEVTWEWKAFTLILQQVNKQRSTNYQQSDKTAFQRRGVSHFGLFFTHFNTHSVEGSNLEKTGCEESKIREGQDVDGLQSR